MERIQRELQLYILQTDDQKIRVKLSTKHLSFGPLGNASSFNNPLNCASNKILENTSVVEAVAVECSQTHYFKNTPKIETMQIEVKMHHFIFHISFLS